MQRWVEARAGRAKCEVFKQDQVDLGSSPGPAVVIKPTSVCGASDAASVK